MGPNIGFTKQTKSSKKYLLNQVKVSPELALCQSHRWLGSSIYYLKYKCLVNILKIYILLSTNGTYLAILWKAGGKSNTLLCIRQNVNIWTNVCGDIWKLYYVASKLRKSLRDIFNCMQTHIHAGDNWQLYSVTYNLRQELTSHFQLCITGNRKMVLATVFRVMTSEKVRESFWQVGQFDKLEENFCVWPNFHLISSWGARPIYSYPCPCPIYLSILTVCKIPWCLKIMTCQVKRIEEKNQISKRMHLGVHSVFLGCINGKSKASFKFNT